MRSRSRLRWASSGTTDRFVIGMKVVTPRCNQHGRAESVRRRRSLTKHLNKAVGQQLLGIRDCSISNP
jgi:hypothetical protein